MRRKAPIREGNFTPIPIAVRERHQSRWCQVCKEDYGKMRSVKNGLILCRQHLDHLIPRRWLAARGIDPHQDQNILSVCCSCHGKKKALEDKLFHSDVVGWLAGLRQIGYPILRIIDFAISSGLTEFEKFAFTARGQL